MADSGSQIGARLKAAREAAGLTQDDVAEKLGVHSVTVSRWETAGVNARGDTLIRLAALYGRSVESLVSGGRGTVREEPQLSANVSRGTYAKSRLTPLTNAMREYVAELRLQLTRADASDEEIDAAIDLVRSPALFAFYEGGSSSEANEAGVLRGMKAIAEAVVIPELRGRRASRAQDLGVVEEIGPIAKPAGAKKPGKSGRKGA